MTDTAQIILQQLGANRFIAMTGVRQLVNGGSYLQMRLPRNSSKGNMLRITHNARDLYDVELISARVNGCKTVATVENVYCDQLRNVFTEQTGLATHL